MKVKAHLVIPKEILEVASQAAKIVRDQKSKGLTLGLGDAIIAGTCLVNKLTLVTYNRKQYPLETREFFPVPPLDR